MFADIPPDIPKAVVQYVETQFPNKPDEYCTKRWYRYLTAWNGYELYTTGWKRTAPVYCSYPTVIMYDCHTARRQTRQEALDTRYLITKYISTYAKEEHLCHRDKRAYNQHTKPEDYEKKVKHITPKYIPKDVVDFVDGFSDSAYPGTTQRRIKYLTTKDNYEVYLFYWTRPFNWKRSGYHPLIYDCNRVTRPDVVSWFEMKKKEPSIFDVFSRPYLCKKD